MLNLSELQLFLKPKEGFMNFPGKGKQKTPPGSIGSGGREGDMRDWVEQAGG